MVLVPEAIIPAALAIVALTFGLFAWSRHRRAARANALVTHPNWKSKVLTQQPQTH